MALSGYLSEYSLPEIFQFVEQGYKTGLLSIEPEPDVSLPQAQPHYLWIQGGRIIAMANQLDDNGLLLMLKQRGWLNSHLLNLVKDWSGTEQPLGLYLKAQGAITAEQVKLLFHAQVLRPVCALFKLTNAKFAFEPRVRLPKAEMTGLSLSTSEATLLGLRVLRDWSTLMDKLPDPYCGLTKSISGRPQLQLDTEEWKLWEFADGSVSIGAIAKQLQLPVETIQQIAFRLTVVGLIEEIPIIEPESTKQVEVETVPELAVAATSSNKLNQSFLNNLMGFLKARVS